jgi:hypothetical protein
MKPLLCFAILTLLAQAQTAHDAISRSEQLRNDAKEAATRKDYKALLAISLDSARLHNDSASSIESLAVAYVEAGQPKPALEMLRDFVAMGQADDDLQTAPQLDSLKASPQFKQFLRTMERNKAPFQHTTSFIDLHDPKFVPEDIDYDPQARTFLITSVLEKKIVRLAMDGTQTDFATAPDAWPMMALKIDAKRGVVWATEVALDKFAPAPSKDWGRSAVLCLSLKDGSLLRRIEGPSQTALGDMALTPDGDAIVSDGAGGGVYRIRFRSAKSDSLERLDGGDFISPQTPALLPDGRHVFVPDYVRGLGVLDLATKQVRWIETNRRHTVDGIDGLYLTGSNLIAVQNGSSPERVVTFHLDRNWKQVLSEDLIERSTPTLGDPTHGVVIGDNFFYIANSGWNSLDDNGNLKPNSKMTAAHIMKASLKEH